MGQLALFVFWISSAGDRAGSWLWRRSQLWFIWGSESHSLWGEVVVVPQHRLPMTCPTTIWCRSQSDPTSARSVCTVEAGPWPGVIEHADEVPGVPSATRGLRTAQKMENSRRPREVGLVC